MKHIILFFFMLLNFSCSTDSGIYIKSSTVENQIKGHVPSPWSVMNSEGSDFALQNKSTNSIFLFNSACRKYEASNLNALTSSILSGLEDIQMSENKKVSYQDRAAVEITANGKLDGVLRFFRIITIQKNSCIYDYVLISTNNKNLDNDSSSLEFFTKRIILK